jgi:hypothetical protein
MTRRTAKLYNVRFDTESGVRSLLAAGDPGRIRTCGLQIRKLTPGADLVEFFACMLRLCCIGDGPQKECCTEISDSWTSILAREDG